MSLAALLLAGGLITFLLLAGLAVIGFANRRREAQQVDAGHEDALPAGPEQPTLPGIDK
jgi:hypothetical protein